MDARVIYYSSKMVKQLRMRLKITSTIYENVEIISSILVRV